jgi:hypothetical protein
MPRYSRSARIQGTHCTVETTSGNFCDADSAPGSPFPICARHATLLYRWMHGMVTEVMDNHHDYPDIHNAMVGEVADAAHAKVNTRQHKVYYVRVGDLIKVGTTSQLDKRMHAYPPDSVLLAVEPGGEEVEGRRHRQFRHLLAHRKEWFHPGADLLAHIAALPADQVRPHPGW